MLHRSYNHAFYRLDYNNGLGLTESPRPFPLDCPLAYNNGGIIFIKKETVWCNLGGMFYMVQIVVFELVDIKAKYPRKKRPLY